MLNKIARSFDARVIQRVEAKIKQFAGSSSSRVLTQIATLIDYLRFFRSLPSTEAFSLPLESLPAWELLHKNGICIIENFWDEATCAAARAEIERILVEYPDYVHPHPKADFRVFGAENLSDLISRFSNNAMFRSMASRYNCTPTRTAFTMAAKMPVRLGSLGSGEGWHRDAFFRQFKAIIYLSDVTEENGPFQFIEGSYKLGNILKDIWHGKLGYMQNRIRDDQVDALLRKDTSRLQTYTAKAGTLILVDTSSIHRGMPIREGVRYALTDYFFPEERIGRALYEQFAPVAGVIDANKKFVDKR